MNIRRNLLICLFFIILCSSCEEILIFGKNNFVKKANPADNYNSGSIKAMPHGDFLLSIYKREFDADDKTPCGFYLRDNNFEVFMDHNGNFLNKKKDISYFATEKVYHKENFYRISLKNEVTKVTTQDVEYNYFQKQYCFLNQKNEIISVLFKSEYNTGTEIIVNKYNLEFEKLASEFFKTKEYISFFNPTMLFDNETIMAVSSTIPNNFVITKITDDLKISQVITKNSFYLNPVPNNQKKLFFAEINNLNKKTFIYELMLNFDFKKIAEFNEIFVPNYIDKTENGLVLYSLNTLNNEYKPIIEFSKIDKTGNKTKKILYESNIKINCLDRRK